MVILDQPLPLPDGTPVRVEPIAFAPGDFWQSDSLEELARRQGVTAPGGVEDLLNGLARFGEDAHRPRVVNPRRVGRARSGEAHR